LLLVVTAIGTEYILVTVWPFSCSASVALQPRRKHWWRHW